MSALHGDRQRAFPIVIVGHVDHGKSTLVGRLLNDTDSLPNGKLEEIRRISEKRNMGFEWSFVLDALQVERDQGITVDTTQIWFRTAQRPYVIIDAPGHKEFLKNMVTGAASADAAVLVVDAAQGVSEQTRRHAYMLNLIGVHQVVAAINKMDLVDHGQARFEAVTADLAAYLDEIGVHLDAAIPVSARNGDNIVNPSDAMDWYKGATLIEALDGFATRAAPLDQPLRLPVQDIYRIDDKRVIVGRIESGRLRVGDRLRISPGRRSARLANFESWGDGAPVVDACAGQSVALTFDEDVFIERGHVISTPDDAPSEGHAVRVRLFWLDREPLVKGERIALRLATARHSVTVEQVEHVIDVEDLSHGSAERVGCNEVAEVVLRSRARMAFDSYDDHPHTGRAVLVRDHRIVGGCVLLQPESGLAAEDSAGRDLTRVHHSVLAADRAAANGHRGGVVWLTGLSGAGKSTLAMAAQSLLFERGRHVYVLDGDNVRLGLNRDLGFGPESRAENIRRVAEVARLFADAGMIVITAFISPYRADREAAREIAGGSFREIYVSAGLQVCEARDPKGLYRRARAGEIAEFTGVSAPYEAPTEPDLLLDTALLPVDKSVADLVSFVERSFAIVRTGVRAVG